MPWAAMASKGAAISLDSDEAQCHWYLAETREYG